ncbi:Hypothetical predicted protein [Mytilus galloprovincialis]|uniref:Uncharacterized protein n=1 Tax=Mytilus galloprovincialis TaxID=29158 RepID=A0A8B6H983_MYTGA|nr:Hypothetical predicted protein [Mytilus galloprovincialis]
MAFDVSILITIDEGAKVAYPIDNNRRMFDLSNSLNKISRKSTMKLTDDFISELNKSRYLNIHLPLQKSLHLNLHHRETLPINIHRRETKDTRRIDIRSFESKAADTIRPGQRADIVTTESRVQTFVTNGWRFPKLYPLHLSAAGFYYRGKGTEIHCHRCNIKTDVSTWSENEKPDLAHARLAKDCTFVIDNGFNLKLTKQTKDYHRTATAECNSNVPSNQILSGYTNHVSDETLTNSSSGDNKRNTGQTLTSGNVDCGEQQKYSCVQEMLTNQSPCKPFDIMSDGFIGLTINKNREDTQPFLTENHIGDINENPTTGRNDAVSEMDAMNSQITHDGLQSYHQEFKYPQFESVDARYRSFDNWSFAHKQTPRKLSEAGYFYTGENDIVRCFCCDLGLAEWDPKDNPWTEHARHNPKCWFLLSEKGEQFIENIQHDWKKIYNPKHAAFDDKESRIATFDGWRTDIEQTPDILADAGFFYTGMFFIAFMLKYNLISIFTI